MPQRRFFRSQRTGRFISAAQAEQEAAFLYTDDPSSGQRTVTEYFPVTATPEAPEEREPFWTQGIWDRGINWRDFDPSVDQSLSDFAPPDGVNAFRVFVDTADNPDYPRGKASTGWMGIEAWPPDLSMIRGVDPTGYHEIRFRRN